MSTNMVSCKLTLNVKPSRIYILVFLISVITALSWTFMSLSRGVEASSDNEYYFNLGIDYYADGMASAYSKIMPNVGLIYVGPIQPLVNGLFIYLFGPSWTFIRVFNILIFCLLTCIVLSIGIQLKSNALGLFAAIWTSLYIPLLSSTLFAGKDLYMTFMMVLIVHEMVALLNKDDWKRYLSLASLYVIAIHLDERFLILGFLIIALYLYSLIKHRFQNIRKPLISILLIALLCVPWLVRNYQVYGKIVFLTIRLSPIIDPILGQEEFKDLGSYSGLFYLSEAQIDSVKAGTKIVYYGNYLQRPTEIIPIPPGAINKIKRGDIPSKLPRYKQVMIGFCNMFFSFDVYGKWGGDGYVYYPAQSRLSLVREVAQYYSMLPFFLIGTIVILKRKLKSWSVILFTILLYASINIIFVDFVNSRYRLPLIPLIFMVSWYGVFIVIFELGKLSHKHKESATVIDSIS